MELTLKTTQKFQLVQKVAARLLSGAPVLKELHWLPTCFQDQFKVLVLTFMTLEPLIEGPSHLHFGCGPNPTLKNFPEDVEAWLFWFKEIFSLTTV